MVDRMRRGLVAALTAVMALVGALAGGPAAAAAPGAAGEPSAPVELVLFYGAGCPHCAAEIEFLAGLVERQPTLTVRAYEVWYDDANRALFRRIAAAHGIEAQAVPTTIVGDRVWVGFDRRIGTEIERTVAALAAGEVAPPPGRTTIDVPLVGPVDVGSEPLLVATLLIGFVDGINPCSLWVLSMLLALVLHSRSRTRVAAVGLTFLAVTALLYGLFIAGLFSALSLAAERTWIRLVVAAVAATFGALHVKEYVTTAGPSLTIPAARKPGMYRRMRHLSETGRSLPAALGGTAVLALGVSVVETPCTAGLPVLWTDLVRAEGVGWAGWTVLLALYLAVFLVDELLVFGLAVATMRATKLQERHGRVLQLVSGTLMLALAGVMVLAPGLLEQVGGTVAVFAAAAAVVMAVLVAERWWSAAHRAGRARVAHR